jgi:hypothetical protein
MISQYVEIGSQCPKALVDDPVFLAKCPDSAVIARIGIKAVLDDSRFDFG